MTINYAIDVIKASIGKRIILGGQGIMDGLKFNGLTYNQLDKENQQFVKKFNSYKIIDVRDNGDIVLKASNARRNSILPVYNQNQDFQLI